jgi:hypothetical protein
LKIWGIDHTIGGKSTPLIVAQGLGEGGLVARVCGDLDALDALDALDESERLDALDLRSSISSQLWLKEEEVTLILRVVIVAQIRRPAIFAEDTRLPSGDSYR